MENTEISDVEIADSELEGVITEEQPEPTPEEKASEEKAGDEEKKTAEKTGDEQPDDETTPGDEEEEKEPSKVVIGEKEYTLDEVKEAFQGAMRQQDYTTKTQELSTQRKALEPMVQFIEKLKGNSELLEAIQETIEEVLGEDDSKLFQTALEMDPEKVVNPFADEVKTLQDELDLVNAKMAYENEVADLKSKYKVADSDVTTIAEFALQQLEETGQLLTLEQAFKMMNYDKVIEEINSHKSKKPPNPPKSLKKKVGAKALKEKEKPVESFEDISIEGFNLITD